MRARLCFWAGSLLLAGLCRAQVPLSHLKSEGRSSQPYSACPSWSSTEPKLNSLPAAKEIAAVRAAFKNVRSKDGAFREASHWVRTSYSTPVQTCAALEAFYHLQLWVHPTEINIDAIKSAWNAHRKLSNSKVVEHVRQAVLASGNWDCFPVPSAVSKAIFSIYEDDPAMGSFLSAVSKREDPHNNRVTMWLITEIEKRRDNLKGFVLDGQPDAERSRLKMNGSILIGLWYTNDKTQKAKVASLFRELEGYRDPDSKMKAYIEGIRVRLKARGWI